jgi:hypothetical protein
LIEAVKEYGNDWNLLATMFPGRTNDQCRQRWVKSLDPAIDWMAAYNKDKWTVKEDAKLTDVAKEHGDNNWVAVVALVPGRTSANCRQRWAKCLNPNINR